MKNSKQYLLFEKTHSFLTQKKYIHIFVLLIEHYLLLIEIVKSTTLSIHIDKNFNDDFFLNKLSLLFYFRKIKCNNKYPYESIIAIELLQIVHGIYFFIDKLKKNNIVSRIIINFYNVVYYRLFSIFIFDIFANYVIAFANTNNKNDIIVSMLALIVLIILLLIFYLYYNHHYVFINIQNENYNGNFPYDYISKRNDGLILLLKIMTVFQDNIFSITYNIQLVRFFSFIINFSLIFILMRNFAYFIVFPSLLLINYDLHLFRFGFLISTSFWNFSVLFNIYKDKAFFYITGISSLVFSFTLLIVLNQDFYKNCFLNDMNELTNLILILKIKNSDEDTKLKYIERIIYHMSKCNNTCDFCKIYSIKTNNQTQTLSSMSLQKKKEKDNTKSNDLSLYIYYTVFLSIFKRKAKGMMKRKITFISRTVSKDIKSIYSDFFSVLEYSFFNRNTTFKFRYFLTYLINKYNQHDVTVSMNLLLLYRNLFENKSETDITLIKEMNLYIILIEKLSKIIEKISNYIISEVKSPKQFLKLGYEVYDLKDKDHMKFLIKRQKSNDYSIELITYLLEEITNTPVNKDHGMFKEDILLNEELLSYHYAHSQNIILLFNPIQNATIIKKAGKDMNEYVGKEFTLLFPREFRENGISKFKASLNQDNEIKVFDFILRKDSNVIHSLNDINKGYVRFIMNYKLFYEDLNSNYYLNGEYRFDANEIVLSRTKKENIDRRVSNIVMDFSMTLLPCNNILKGINRHSIGSPTGRFSIVQNEIETNIEVIHSINIKCVDMNIIMNYLRKVNNKKKDVMMTQLFYKKSEKLIVLKDIDESLSRIEHPEKKKSSCVINMIKSKKNAFGLLYSIDTQSNTYKVYSKVNTIGPQNRETNSKIGTTMISVFENEARTGTIQINDSSSLCASTNSSISVLSYLQRERAQININIEKIYKQYQNRFVSITKITFSFCLLIIIFSIISLIIELRSNEVLLDSYSVYTELRALNRLFYNTITSILAVICVGNTVDDSCFNYYKVYNDNYNIRNNISYASFEYSVYENKYKLDDFGSMLSRLKKSIYKLNDKKASALFNSAFNYSYLSVIGDEITVMHQTVTFSNALEMLLNGLTIMVEDDNYINGPVYIFTLRDFDFRNIRNKSSLNIWQYEYYNLVMNYQKYLDNWVNIQISLSDNTNGKLNTLSRIVIIFMNISNIFHIMLFGLLFYFIYNFENLFMMNMNKMMLKFNDENYMHLFIEKYKILKVLVKFFEENPVRLIKDINSLYCEFTKAATLNKAKARAPTMQNQSQDEHKKSNTNALKFFSKQQYREITLTFYVLIFCIFIYYVVLIGIFLFVWVVQIARILNVFEIITENTVSACSGYNVFALCQIMLLANQTQSEISINMKYSGDDYLIYESHRSINSIFEMEERRKKVGSLIKTTNDYLDLNCETFYTAINDKRFNELEKNYPQFNFKSNYSSFCNTFRIMEYKNDFLFYENVFYEINKFARSVSHLMSYDDILNAMLKGNIFFMCDLQFLLYRPFRSWFNDVVYSDAINNSINLEKRILFTVLGTSIASEVIIFTILYFELFKKLSKINRIIIGVRNVFKVLK